MDKDKVIKIAGGALVATAICAASVYGLSQTEGSPIYGFFNNSANEQTGKVENSANTSDEKSKKSEIAENLVDSEQSIADAKNSKFEMNRKLDWSADDILKTPTDDNYVYKEDDPSRRVKNHVGVKESKFYAKQVEAFSAVNANRKYRNATDETYESARQYVSTAFSALQSRLKTLYDERVSSAGDPELEKIYREYFGSDSKYLVNLGDAMNIDGHNLEIDENTFRLRMTSNQDEGVYAFEVILVDKTSKKQMAYVSGFYNSKVQYLKVTSSIFLKDGAVAKDRWSYEAPGLQY